VFILLKARQVPMLVLWLIVVGIAGAAPVALAPMVTAETLGLKRSVRYSDGSARS
jgi:hypothetical protein